MSYVRIALVNTIKPQEGSGDGITEVAYRLYENIRKKNRVDLIYPIESSARNDIKGLAYANTIFRSRVGKQLSKDYDIIHIANQEMGYVARMAKQMGLKAKVVTFMFDFMRIKSGFQAGMLQNIYSKMVMRSIHDAKKYSDLVVFSATDVKKEAEELLGEFKNSRVIYMGQAHDAFRKAPLPKRRKREAIRIGFVGALSYRKNAIFILKTAELLRNSPDYQFIIYGSGAEAENLKRYKEEKGLDNVSFMGFAPENKLMGIYDGFDVFFYPSLEEGTSTPVFDAQARGLAVILCKKTKMTSEVKKHSIIAKDEMAAARILERIRKAGYPSAKRTAEIRYARSFSWERAATETLEAYKSLVEK